MRILQGEFLHVFVRILPVLASSRAIPTRQRLNTRTVEQMTAARLTERDGGEVRSRLATIATLAGR